MDGQGWIQLATLFSAEGLMLFCFFFWLKEKGLGLLLIKFCTVSHVESVYPMDRTIGLFLIHTNVLIELLLCDSCCVVC